MKVNYIESFLIFHLLLLMRNPTALRILKTGLMPEGKNRKDQRQTE